MISLGEAHLNRQDKAHSEALHLVHAAVADSCISADIEYSLIFSTLTFHLSRMHQTQLA